MSVHIESTTDSQEAIANVLGKKANAQVVEQKEVVEEKPPVSADLTEESLDASGALEDDEADESEESGETEKPEKKSGYQKRINKLTKQKSTLKKEVEFLKGMLSSKEALEQKPVETKTTNSKEPKPEDFETHEAFVKALAKFEVMQELSVSEAKKREADLKAEQERQIKAHQQRVQEFAKSHGDFDEVISEVDDIPMSLAVQQTILDSDNGPKLMYELAKNKEDYKRICSLQPLQAARELGKIEARVSAETSSPQKEVKTPRAPKPLKPVTSASAVSTKAPDEMSLSEYRKWRETGGGT